MLSVEAVALSAARAFGAHIHALHVRFDPVEVAVKLASDTIGTSLARDLIEKLEEDVRAGEAQSEAFTITGCARNRRNSKTQCRVARGNR